MGRQNKDLEKLKGRGESCGGSGGAQPSGGFNACPFVVVESSTSAVVIRPSSASVCCFWCCSGMPVPESMVFGCCSREPWPFFLARCQVWSSAPSPASCPRPIPSGHRLQCPSARRGTSFPLGKRRRACAGRVCVRARGFSGSGGAGGAELRLGMAG